MTIYELNNVGIHSLQEKTKDFYKMIIGGAFFYILQYIVTKFTIDSFGLYIFMVVFLSVICVLIFIYIPISLKLNINKVVKKIQIDGSNLILTTKRAKAEYNFSDLEIFEVNNRFTGFGAQNMNGILLKTKTNQQYWIIENFYNDFEILKTNIFKVSSEYKVEG